MDNRILRIIDADLNRGLEGLRVCEEITRFVLCDKGLTMEFKNLRHNIVGITKKWVIDKRFILEARDSAKDVGSASIKAELKRDSYKDIFFANIQRTKESVRVLEEFAKLSSQKVSRAFKNIRYNLYQLEKKTNSRILSIRRD